MAMPAGSNQTVLNEIIDNAAGLPLEGQYTVLMIAKAMQFTRSCMERKAGMRSAGHSTAHPHKYSGQSSQPGTGGIF